MTFIIDPYRFVVITPPAAGPGDMVLVHRTSVSAIPSVPSAYPFDAADIYDTFDGHDPAVNNTRITFPSAGLVRIGANAETSTGDSAFEVRKNGSVFVGRPATMRGTLNFDLANLKSPPLVVDAGDYIELFRIAGGVADYGSTGNWFFAEYLEPTLKYCIADRTTGQAFSAGTGGTLNWNSEVVDTDSWHDNSVNNNRLTVPAGVSRVRVTCCISTTRGPSSGANILFLSIRKNGAETAHGIGSQSRLQATNQFLNPVSGIMNVSPGDYFDVAIFTDSATTIDGGSGTSWLAIEEIPSTYRCVLVKRSSNQSISAATPTIINWNDEEFDDDNMHDNSVNPSRLTVPSGATKARLSFNVISNPLNGNISGRILKNGSFVVGLPSDRRSDGTGSGRSNGLSAWIDVVPGDYFEAEFFSGVLSANIGNSPFNWFCMEIM